MRVLFLLFQSGLLLFLFLFWLLWLKLPKLWQTVVMRVGILVLFLTLGEMLSIFCHWDNVCCEIILYGFYCVEVCSFYACFLERFNHKWVLNFVKGILCIYWDTHTVFIFQFANVKYQINWLANTEESLHLWDKAHLVLMYGFFKYAVGFCLVEYC